MTYTVSKVRNSRPDLLLMAAVEAELSAQRIDARIVDGRAQTGWLHEDWVGTASDAAAKQYGELISCQQTYVAKMRAAKAALDTHGPKLVKFRADLDAAVNAAEDRWNVADDGSVSLSRMLIWYLIRNPTQVFKTEAMRIEIESNIKLLLAQFEAEDLAAGHAIRQVGRELQ